MWPDGESNPGPLTYESGALPTALRGQRVPCWSLTGGENLLQPLTGFHCIQPFFTTFP